MPDGRDIDDRPSSAEIGIHGIDKHFGAGKALDAVDLSIRRGELIGLLGPSGSGKTTLLRVIAGLEIPDRGRVLFDGDDVTDRPVQERGVGFVFQHYALFKHLSVFDNIAYGPRARRRTRPAEAEIARRVGDLIALVQLEGLAKRFPSQLSGGQRQRVALARALAVEPRVLLLDEPFGALDARVRKDLRRWLRDIHKRTGQTTIFVTHDQDEALELSDRVAILNRGRLEQVGGPDEIYDAPASAFVMSFVGESLRLPVSIAGGVASFEGARLPLDAGAIRDGEASLFVRPWDVAIATDGQGVLEGTIGLVRRIASGRRAEMLLGEKQAVLEIDVHDDVTLQPGERVRLSLRAGRIFPAA